MPFHIFIGLLCDVAELFVYLDFQRPDPVIEFWTKLANDFRPPRPLHEINKAMPPSLASALMECLLRTWRSWKISCLADVDNGEGLTHFVVVTCLVARSLEACVHTYILR